MGIDVTLRSSCYNDSYIDTRSLLNLHGSLAVPSFGIDKTKICPDSRLKFLVESNYVDMKTSSQV